MCWNNNYLEINHSKFPKIKAWCSYKGGAYKDERVHKYRSYWKSVKMGGVHTVFVEYQLVWYVLTVGGGGLVRKYCGLHIVPILSGTKCVYAE